MSIDSHQHFWKYNPVNHAWINDEMRVIQKDFFPAQLKSVLDQNKIEGSVAVQADQTKEENEFLLGLAGQHDFIKGVVGWVDLRSENLERELQQLQSNSKLKGFRHVVQGEPKGFLSDTHFVNGVRTLAEYNFTYDLLVYHHQLEEAVQFVKQLGGNAIVVDHIAKPAIKDGDINTWKRHMKALASFDNVYCKISGMVTEADWKNWKHEDFVPYLDEIFEVFGTNRIMYGSDWPVCLVAASYEQQLGIISQYLSSFSEAEKRQVMGANAKTFYNL
jgi:L-fuconolactonase